MLVDPIIVDWILIAGACFCTFKIGRLYNNIDRDTVIENTILYLISNNFIRAHKVNGEWEIENLDEQK